MKKVQKIDHPIMEHPEDETCDTYKPVLNDRMLTTREAVSRLNRRMMKKGKIVTTDLFYHWVLRGKVRVIQIQGHNLYHPYDIDRIKISNDMGTEIQPEQVHSLEDLKRIAKKYNDVLVDIEGILEILFEKTGHKYTPGAIKQRLHRKTIYYVAYTGKKRKHYWFPASQVDHWNLQPSSPKRRGNADLQE